MYHHDQVKSLYFRFWSNSGSQSTWQAVRDWIRGEFWSSKVWARLWTCKLENLWRSPPRTICCLKFDGWAIDVPQDQNYSVVFEITLSLLRVELVTFQLSEEVISHQKTYSKCHFKNVLFLVNISHYIFQIFNNCKVIVKTLNKISSSAPWLICFSQTLE